MPGKLTTHVLDTAHGTPAAGMHLRLDYVDGGERERLVELTLNDDGRADGPLLTELTPGTYRLLFDVADYFRTRGHPDAGKFLDRVPILFVVDDPDAHYHVPLLVSPWSYSTYRGS
ncbi:MAG: hydroxyisourate hydrolase [Planctomycetota bacterium]